MPTTYGPRHRDDSTEYGDVPYHNDILYCNGTTGVQEGSSELPTGLHGSGTERWMDDVVVKDFHSRSKRGEIFNNPMTQFTSEYQGSMTGSWVLSYQGSCSGTTKRVHSGNSHRGLLTVGFDDSEIPSWSAATNVLQIAAGTQAWGNVVNPSVLGGESGRDAGATYQMLRHPLLNLHNFLDKVRNTKKFAKQSLALGEFLSSQWLQYRYGLTPLFYDLEGALEAAFKPVFTDRYTARGSASTQFGTESTVSTSETYFDADQIRVTRRNVYVRAGVLYQHEFTWSDKWGLSMHNLPATLWEWLPLSFVYDWIVNAGDFISAVTPKANVKILSSWTTTTVETDYELELVTTNSRNVAPYNSSGGPGGYFTRKSVWKRRDPFASRGLVLKLYDLDLVKDRNLLHIVDGLALAAQKLMRTFKAGKSLPSGSSWDRNWRYGSRGYTGGWKGGTL